MKFYLKQSLVAILLIGSVSVANADTCNTVPGSITCGVGTVDALSGNGMVNLNGTIVTGSAIINGLLNAEDASFHSLDVNGSANLIQCTINGITEIKGSLSASSTKFQRELEVYSSSVRFINSKASGDLHIHHTDSKKQIVYLDNFSEVSGNIIFDDGEGEVVLRGQSKIGGKVIGGQMASK